MAKLEIRLKEEVKKQRKEDGLNSSGYKFNDYDVLIDGQEPSDLLSLKLELNAEKFNQASVTFLVDDLQMDADTLTELNAILNSKEKITS